MSKHILLSKTFWINLVAAGLGWFLTHQGILQAAGIGAQDQIAILAVINVINRFFTSESVHIA